MDLNAIKFNVETSALDASIKKIDEVATALGNMSSKVKEATTVKQNAAKADKEAIANATALAKLKQEEAKAISLAAKASADEAKAKETQSNSTKKVVESSESQAKAADKVTEALSGTDRILAKQALSMQILRGEIVSTSDGVVSLGNGFTKSQSSMLANLQMLGATGKEMQTLARSFEDYNRITGLNTFDKSASGISKLKKELAELNQINSISASGMSLTRDEIVNYMRDSERLVQQQKSEGHSTEWLAQEQAALKAAYMTTATELNRLRAESKQMEDQAKREAQAKIKAAQDVSKAQAFVNKEMERANAAYLAAVGDDKLNVSTSNRLLKMEQALKATGMSAQQAESQLAQYKRTLTAVQKASSDRAVDTISRALGPQITDITVGLATGQSLMTVLLQQGGQLRDQMTLAGVAADQMGVAIRKAGSEMVSSVWATGKGVIGGIAGAFLDLGRSAGVAFAQSLSGAQKFITSMFLSQAAAENYAKGLDSAFSKTGRFINFMENSKAAATVFAGGIAVLATTLISLGVAFVQLSNEQDRIAKSFSLNSAQLGLTASSAFLLADSYQKVGINTKDAVVALEEMAKTGNFTRSQVETLVPSIVRLNKAAGEDMQTTVARFKELGKDPVKALNDLQMSLGTVPVEMIKATQEAVRMGEGLKAMQIAAQAADVAAERAAQNIKLYYSPMGQLFKDIADAAGKMWNSIRGVVTGKSAVETLRNETASLKDMVATRNEQRKWGSVDPILQSRIVSQVAKVRELQSAVENEWRAGQEKQIAAQKARTDDLIKSLLPPAEQLRQEAKSIGMDEYVQRSLRIKDPEGLISKSSKEYSLLVEKAKKEWEDIQNKGSSKSSGGGARKPVAPGLFDIGLETGKASNALSEVNKFYDAQSSILENSYKSNEISLGSYLSQELTLIENQANKKREIQANLIEQLNLQEQSDLSKLEKWKSTLAETEDKKRAEKMITDTKDKYQKARESAQSSIIGLVDDVKSQTMKALKELDQFATASKKNLEEYQKYIREKQAGRGSESQMNMLDITLSGKELEIQKARIQALKETNTQIADQVVVVEKLQEAYDKLKASGNPASSAAFMRLQGAKGILGSMQTQQQTVVSDAGIGAGINFDQNKLKEYLSIVKQLDLGTTIAEGFDSASKAVATMISNLAKLSSMQSAYYSVMQTGTDEQKKQIKNDYTRAKINVYGDMASDMKGYFKEHTAGYKVLAATEKAFRLMEIALQAKSVIAMVTGEATKTAATASGEAARNTLKIPGIFASFMSMMGPWGIPAAAAAIAAIGLSAYGRGNVSGSFEADNKGTGTVLGMKDKGSESITNALESLKDIGSTTNKYSAQMALSLKNIENNIGGLTSLLVRSGDISASAANIKTGFQRSSIGNIAAFSGNFLGSIFEEIPVIGQFLGGGIMKGIANFVGNLFGSSTKLKGQGIYGYKQTVASVLDTGFQAAYYNDIEKKDKFLGVTTSTSNSTKYYAASAELEQQFTSIIISTADSIRTAGKIIGMSSSDIDSTLNSFVVSLGKINTLNKSGEEIQTLLENVFSANADKMAQAVIPGFEKLQRVGEGYYETLVRVATGLEQANTALDMIGKTAFAVSKDGAIAADSLIELFGEIEDFTSSVSNYMEKFFSEEEILAKQTEQLREVFISLGMTLPATRAEYRSLVDSLDLTTESGKESFKTLMGLSDAFYEITKPLEEATQKMKEFTNSILEYINSLSMSEGNASQNYAYAQAVFGQQLLLAKAGDETAMENITSYSDKLIELAKSNAGSALEFETILGSIKAELLGLATTAPAGSVLTSGLTPSALSAPPVVSTASQIAEQTATTQTLLANILTKLTEMQAEDRAEGVQNVVNLNSIAKVVKRIDNGDSIRTFAVTV